MPKAANTRSAGPGYARGGSKHLHCVHVTAIDIRAGMTTLLLEVQYEIDQMAIAMRRAMQEQPEPQRDSRLVDEWTENLRSVEAHTMWRLAFWQRNHAVHTTYPATNSAITQSFYFSICNELGHEVSTQFRECIRRAIIQECPRVWLRLCHAEPGS